MAAKLNLILKFTVTSFCILYHIEAQLEEWKIPCGAIYKPKHCENASIETLTTVEDYERCAPARLDVLSREYAWGGSGTQQTLFENKKAYSRIWIKKKVLRGLSNYSLETSVLGRKIGFPLGISPTTGHESYHPEGILGTVRAAASLGVVMVMDMLSLTSLEDVAAAAAPHGTELWMQTYILHDRKKTLDIVKRAERAGYKAIVVTIDESYASEIRCNVRYKYFDEVIDTSKGTPNLGKIGKNFEVVDPSLTFKELSWLARITSLPIIAKGILTAEDAIQAIEAGASAIFVSNQGGRELDGSLPTIDALPEVVRVVKYNYPWVEVYVDGGIRTGHDIFKALARGAKAAFIGKPAIWGLVMGGEKGVNKILTIFREEFKDAMLHAGFSDPSKITSNNVISKWIYSDYP